MLAAHLGALALLALLQGARLVKTHVPNARMRMLLHVAEQADVIAEIRHISVVKHGFLDVLAHLLERLPLHRLQLSEQVREKSESA